MTVLPALDEQDFPAHIAVIMDGNGRWAKRRGLSRNEGHAQGLEAAKRLVRLAAETPGVDCLTLFTLSHENWNRPRQEVMGLVALLGKAVREEAGAFAKNGVRLSVIGDISRLPATLRMGISRLEKNTRKGRNLLLTLAIGYGGRWDILRAAQSLAESGQAFTEENFSAHLATGDLPPPDLLIRTSGESRISNFMLWQMAYTELYFTDALWPDFDADEFRRALENYQRRERRFGLVKNVSA